MTIPRTTAAAVGLRLDQVRGVIAITPAMLDLLDAARLCGHVNDDGQRCSRHVDAQGQHPGNHQRHTLALVILDEWK